MTEKLRNLKNANVVLRYTSFQSASRFLGDEEEEWRKLNIKYKTLIQDFIERIFIGVRFLGDEEEKKWKLNTKL